MAEFSLSLIVTEKRRGGVIATVDEIQIGDTYSSAHKATTAMEELLEELGYEEQGAGSDDDD